MPALDRCHHEVTSALPKQGWQIKAPTALTGEDGFVIYVDIAAERIRDGNAAYIEVKCFPGRNRTQELYIAFGQYIIYRAFLVKWNIPEQLYLAVPIEAFEELFSETLWQAIRDNKIKLIVVDIEKEEIVQWIEQ